MVSVRAGEAGQTSQRPGMRAHALSAARARTYACGHPRQCRKAFLREVAHTLHHVWVRARDRATINRCARTPGYGGDDARGEAGRVRVAPGGEVIFTRPCAFSMENHQRNI